MHQEKYTFQNVANLKSAGAAMKALVCGLQGKGWDKVLSAAPAGKRESVEFLVHY